MVIPVAVLAVVFALIAVRQVGRVRLQIWQIMLFGAVAVLVTGQIAPIDALKSVNLDVILFLFGMFVVGQALEESGYIIRLSHRLFGRAGSSDHLILLVLLGMGVASAFLMNDTVAIVGTPVVLLLSRKHGISSKLLLLTLAFAVTIGSVMSPIGNPQNLLIAINGCIPNPFTTFLGLLAAPTVINLLLAYALLRLLYGNQFRRRLSDHSQEPIKDHGLALLSKVSVVLLVLLILAKIAVLFLWPLIDFRLTYIALISALPILALSPRRLDIIRKLDWYTLIFFAAMFILMESVWESGFFQSMIAGANLDITSIPAILVVSVLFSQLISNVPLVALYLPMLTHAGASTREMVALAAGSTIAGNLFILGAASNVIIIQNAEKRAGETLTFLEFARVGIPLTIVNTMIYWIFLALT